MPGGVCAVLDYEVEAMAEYVADMAVRLVTPESAVTPAFRKFVSQILTSTRLPSTTILLGMNYLAKRINSMKTQGHYKASEGQVWRYLTVSLLLGSKFLDDNTFQNRSWSEVSGIAVAELNALEFEWVQSMSWRLYVNLDMSKDYQAWLESWREWQQLKKRQAQATRERAAAMVPAINTDVGRYNGNRHSPQAHYKDQLVEYERYHPSKSNRAHYRSRDAAWGHSQWAAPLTPPDSGYGTPDYAMSATSTNAHYNDWFSQAASQAATHYNNRYQHAASHNGYYANRHGNYPAANYRYQQPVWDHGLAECSCPLCLGPMKHAPYISPHGYGLSVVG